MNFNSRVTVSSVKNFQVILQTKGKNAQQPMSSILVQFGKNGDNKFSLDVAFPFSIFQAFGLALGAFEVEWGIFTKNKIYE